MKQNDHREEVHRIGYMVRQIRRKRLMSKHELATKAGLSPRTVTNAEENRPVRGSTIRALANALEVEPQTLL